MKRRELMQRPRYDLHWHFNISGQPTTKRQLSAPKLLHLSLIY